MLTGTPKKVVLSLIFAGFGLGYFATFGSLEMNALLKTQLALLPLQLGLVAYFLWFRPSKPKN